jgi:hypothetical protein
MALPARRADFSHSLVHLTRERHIWSVPKKPGEMVRIERTVSPFEVVKEILASGVIQGSGNSGFVKGWRPAVCLSEIPLATLRYFTTPPEKELAPGTYRPYGLSFSKRAIFDVGGRPRSASGSTASPCSGIGSVEPRCAPCRRNTSCDSAQERNPIDSYCVCKCCRSC